MIPFQRLMGWDPKYSNQWQNQAGSLCCSAFWVSAKIYLLKLLLQKFLIWLLGYSSIWSQGFVTCHHTVPSLLGWNYFFLSVLFIYFFLKKIWRATLKKMNWHQIPNSQILSWGHQPVHNYHLKKKKKKKKNP